MVGIPALILHRSVGPLGRSPFPKNLHDQRRRPCPLLCCVVSFGRLIDAIDQGSAHSGSGDHVGTDIGAGQARARGCTAPTWWRWAKPVTTHPLKRGRSDTMSKLLSSARWQARSTRSSSCSSCSSHQEEPCPSSTLFDTNPTTHIAYPQEHVIRPFLTRMRTTSSHLHFGRLVIVVLGLILLRPIAASVFNCEVVFNGTQAEYATAVGVSGDRNVLGMASDDTSYCANQPAPRSCGRLAMSQPNGTIWSTME